MGVDVRRYLSQWFRVLILISMFAGSVFSASAVAQVRPPVEDAKWMLERLTGVKWPATSQPVQQMIPLILAGDRAAAARIALAQPQFLNVVVKQMALQMSTRPETIREKFNDFTAAFIGVTRDNIDARELLYGNFYYKGDPVKIGTGIPQNLGLDILASNNHYAALETAGYDLGSVLLKVDGQQMVFNDSNGVGTNPDPAGVLTSWTFLGSHAIAGTNRRPVEYAFREFMCLPINEWADTAASDARIARDIDRAPAGSHDKFLTTCKGCHTVMDGFRGAFAFWDFVNRGNNNAILVNSGNFAASGRSSAAADANGVVIKMNINNNVYPMGYAVSGNSWVNNTMRGQNLDLLGFRAQGGVDDLRQGTGVQSFGRLVANSKLFSSCMAKRAFQTVCKRNLASVMSLTEEQALYASLGAQFEQSNYQMKKLFEYVATHAQCQKAQE